ncbi:hypothetical protein [Nocardiopsis sp. TNDT3]|uniref:hypothetical protein n=1 Tax=Nocardiopsis sp. TNDT3 TaxID=2249354 RepID=UPI000E3C8ECE|nr:hypothetical protein [Nocardiopsis sp. TNDT3]
MPLITPREIVTVDTGHLHTVVHTVRNAYHFRGEPFRPEVVRSAYLLREFLLIPRILEQPTTEVFAEELWWVVQAADDIGDAANLPPVGALFTAVDHLQYALAHQAARTCRGLEAVLEADIILAVALRHTDQ